MRQPFFHVADVALDARHTHVRRAYMFQPRVMAVKPMAANITPTPMMAQNSALRRLFPVGLLVVFALRFLSVTVTVTATGALPYSASRITGLRSTPICEISTSTVSPSSIGPTPSQVPVKMASPGFIVTTWLMKLIMVGTSKII